jgi:hypothetical protein
MDLEELGFITNIEIVFAMFGVSAMEVEGTFGEH